jgi:HEAT repeat protein
MGLFGPPNVDRLEAKRDIKGLVKALEYRNKALKYRKGKRVCIWAADALAKIGDPSAVEPLIAALKDSDSEVRGSAAHALGKIADPLAAEPLIAALGDKRCGPLGAGNVCDAAAIALVEIGAAAVEPLIAALKNSDSEVRSSAADALGEIGDSRAVEPLVAALDVTDWSVHRRVAAALDKLAWSPDRGAAGATYWAARGVSNKCVEIGASAVKPLIAALDDEDWKVRNAAAEALGRIGDPSAVTPLIIAFRKGSIGPEALGQIGDPRAAESLISVLGDARYFPGLQAVVEALAQTGDPRAVEPLITALKLGSGSIGWAIARALGVMGDARAIPALEAAASSEDYGVRDCDGVYYGDGGALNLNAKLALDAIKQRSQG